MNIPLSPRAAAVCALGGALAFSVADLLRRVVTPDAGEDPPGIVAAVGAHATVWSVAGALAALSVFLLVPAALASAGLVDGRGRLLTRIGGHLVAAGSIASMAHMVGEFGFPAIRSSAGVDAATTTALDGAGYGPAGAMIAVFILGFTVGLVLMMVGLRRARVVPVWSVVAAVVAVVAGASGGVAVGAVGVIAWLATLGPVAAALAGHGATVASRPDPAFA